MPKPDNFLREQGLDPLEWEDVLRRVEHRLSPEDASTFTRLHRAFVAYPAEHTCKAFYDFAARHDLRALLDAHRYERLATLRSALEKSLQSISERNFFPDAKNQAVESKRFLDVGAGGGVLATWLRDQAGAYVSVTDLSPATVARLRDSGFPEPIAGDRFDLILCADSLGEIHADEDDWLSAPEHGEEDDFEGELEARYGFVHKLAALKPLLAPGGSLLLFEPVPLEHFWRGTARLLEDAGWTVDVLGPTPTWGLRLTSKS